VAAARRTVPEERIRGYLAAMLRVAIQQPEIVRAHTALSSEGVTLVGLRDGIRQFNREARRSVYDAIEAGVAEGTFRPVGASQWVDFLIGSLLGASIQAGLHREGFDSAILFQSVHDNALLMLGLNPRLDIGLNRD